MSSRWWACGALGALLVCLVVVALVRVPWTPPPAPRADQLAAMRDMPADLVARGKEFHAALRLGSYGSLVLGLAIAVALGFTPLGARIVETVGRPFGGNWIAQAMLGGLAIVLIGEVVSLPVAAVQEMVLRRYGLSTQTWSSWTVDLAKGYAVGAVIGAITLLGFFGLARLAPRWWWAFAAAGAAGLAVLFSFVFPVLVEPIFNKFTPMPAGPLRENLVAMAARDGVPVRDVLVADASRRTTALNAYVSGLGPTRRIVVYDTLLRDAPAAEVEAVVAHELGHAKENDVFTATLLGALGVAAAVCAVYLLGSWTGLLQLAGVRSVAEPRAVALLIALATVAAMVATPLQNSVSRLVEARADAHALAVTQDPATVELMERRLAARNLSDVDPPWLEYVMFASHPSIVERVAAARAYGRGER
jgi:STE24 endopeptidase